MSHQLRELNDLLYHSAILYERVGITPDQFTNINEHIEKQLKRKVGNKCTKEGFISKKNIKILDRSIGVDYGSKMNGNIIYTVKYEAQDILMPRVGQIITCPIKEINESSFMCDYDNKIFISVPLKYYETEDVSNNLTVGEVVDVEVKRIAINSNNIFVVGKLQSTNGNRIDVVNSRISPESILNVNVQTGMEEVPSHMYEFSQEQYDMLCDLTHQIKMYGNMDIYFSLNVYYDFYMVQKMLSVNPYSDVEIPYDVKNMFFDLWQLYIDTKLLQHYVTQENDGKFKLDVLYVSFNNTFPFYSLKNKMTYGQEVVSYVLGNGNLKNSIDFEYHLTNINKDNKFDLIVVNDVPDDRMLQSMINILNTISSVKIGGSFVIKTRYVYTKPVVQLIHLLYAIFNEVHIIRTLNASQMDDTVYIVCISKLTDEKDKMIDEAHDVCVDKLSTDNVIDNLFDIVPDDDIVKSIGQVYYSILSTMYSTINKISTNIEIIKNDASIVVNNHQKYIGQWMNIYKSPVFNVLDITKIVNTMIELTKDIQTVQRSEPIVEQEQDGDDDEEEYVGGQDVEPIENEDIDDEDIDDEGDD